ncbi:MAG: radical SAM protein [Patescibacteria group bacterium]|jgi:radical SAM protein with 4Fe4S-binding SPASM domain
MGSELEPDLQNWAERIKQLAVEHPLQIISWEATRRCNLCCVHCGSPSEDSNLIEELTTEEVVNAFDQIAADFDMDKFHHINITGGEPFVRSDLLVILEQLSRHSCYRNIDIQTNGIYVAEHPGILPDLKQLGVTGLGVSIDGLETTHNKFRRHPDGFRKAWQAAASAVQEGMVVTVSVVAHSQNIVEIPELFRMVQTEIHPRFFRIMTIDSIGRAELDREYLLSDEQIAQVIEFLKKQFMQNFETYADPSATMVELGCGGWLGCELEGTFRPYFFHCIAGLNNLGILHDGKLASCSNISREFVQGDLRQERIKDVWDNRYQKFRVFDWKKTGPCVDCSEWPYCHGGPMHKRKLDGELLECLYQRFYSVRRR